CQRPRGLHGLRLPSSWASRSAWAPTWNEKTSVIRRQLRLRTTDIGLRTVTRVRLVAEPAVHQTFLGRLLGTRRHWFGGWSGRLVGRPFLRCLARLTVTGRDARHGERGFLLLEERNAAALPIGPEHVAGLFHAILAVVGLLVGRWHAWHRHGGQRTRSGRN